MKLLCEDVHIIPAGKDGAYCLDIPDDREPHIFGEPEKFLLESLRTPYHERVLLAKFNARFSRREDMTYLQEYLSMLDDWGLLCEEGERERPGRNRQAEDIPPVEQQDPADVARGREESFLNHWSFFCPRMLFDKTAALFSLSRHFLIIVLMLFATALLGLVMNLSLFQKDMVLVTSKFSFYEHLVFSLFTINLFSQIARGTVARYFGLDTPSFGMMLAYNIIPHFDVKVQMGAETERKVSLWLSASPLLVRMVLFSAGILIWLVTRKLGTNLYFLSASLALFNMTSFLFTVNPLWEGEGYRILALWLNMPNLRERAGRALRHIFVKPPEAVARYTQDSWALKIFGAAILLYFLAFVFFIGYTLEHWLKANYRGLGIVLFFCIIIFYIQRVRYLSAARKNIRAGNEKLGVGGASFFVGRPKSVPVPDQAAPPRKIRLRRILILTALVFSLFLPYNYEVGGTAEVFPVLHQEIFSEDQGVVDKVHFNGGELVERGIPIAEMESYKQRRDISVTVSAIAKKKEEINILLTTPSEEDVKLARQKLASAKLKLEYSIDNAQRYEKLYKQQNVAQLDYLLAKERMDVDQEKVAEQEAALLAIQSQVNTHQLEAARIELKMLEKDLVYYEEELERTKILMPNDGTILTLQLKDLEKKYLKKGDKFADVEDARTVRIEISIPEADIGLVDIGNSARFRLQTFAEETIEGKISGIYPATEKTDYGMIVRVVCLVPNEGYSLKSGMTGKAKVAGRKLFVFQAFSRVLLNFFRIEFWSWLP